MLKIDENNNITFTRGDTLLLNVDIQDAEGNPYEIQSNEELRIFVKYYTYKDGGKTCQRDSVMPHTENTVKKITNIVYKTPEGVGAEPKNTIAVSASETSRWNLDNYYYSVKLYSPTSVFTIIDNARLDLID